MNWGHVFLTMGKELRETLRDRRTLAVMILFPIVVYPLLSLVLTQVITGREQEGQARPSKVAVADRAPAAEELRRLLAADKAAFTLVPKGTAAEVEAGTLDALVDTGKPGKTELATLTIVFDASRDESRRADDRLVEVLERMLPAGCAPRFEVKPQDLASGTKIGSYVLSKALPALVVLMVLLGAFYPAIDVTAGERERGTLETLLAAPMRRFDLLLGKVLAVTLLAAATGLLNLVSMSLTLVQAMHIALPGAVVPVPWTRVAATALVLLPAALFFSSAFVFVGSLARGFKDAQNLMMPAYVMVLVPTLVGAVGEFGLTGPLTLAPGMNVTLLAREITLGHATLFQVAGVLFSTALYAAIALALAARLYDSERLLSVTEPGTGFLGRSTKTRRVERTGPLSAEESMGLFAVAFALHYYVFSLIETAALVPGIIIAQWAGMLGLSWQFAKACGSRPAVALGLRRPTFSAAAGGVLIGTSAWVAVALLTEWIAPPPKELADALRQQLLPADGSRSLAVALFAFALTPAICEEALFRGALLRGLATRMSPVGAGAITAFLFGLFHLSVDRLLPTTLLGMLLGYVAWQSQSLVPSMLAHAVNNGLLLLMAAAGLDEKIEHLGKPRQAVLFAGALVLIAGGAWLVRPGKARIRQGDL